MRLGADVLAGRDGHRHDLGVRPGEQDAPKVAVLLRQFFDVSVERRRALLGQARAAAAQKESHHHHQDHGNSVHAEKLVTDRRSARLSDFTVSASSRRVGLRRRTLEGR